MQKRRPSRTEGLRRPSGRLIYELLLSHSRSDDTVKWKMRLERRPRWEASSSIESKGSVSELREEWRRSIRGSRWRLPEPEGPRRSGDEAAGEKSWLPHSDTSAQLSVYLWVFFFLEGWFWQPVTACCYTDLFEMTTGDNDTRSPRLPASSSDCTLLQIAFQFSLCVRSGQKGFSPKSCTVDVYAQRHPAQALIYLQQRRRASVCDQY